MTAAIIDLGSNSARIGIYRKTASGIEQIQQVRFSVRLSEGLAQTNRLQEPAMARTLAAFQNMREILLNYPEAQIICVATEAMRRAENAADFQQRVLRATGIGIDIISGELETELGLAAAKQSAGCANFYMLDTGGGSFELALCENGHSKAHICLPYGAVVLTETFHPDQNGPKQLHAFMQKTLAAYPFITPNGWPIVLLGGSNRALGKLYRQTADDTQLDGLHIPASCVMRIMDTVIQTPLEKRADIVGMERSRMDIITAGLAPLRALMKQTCAKELIICTKSLRDGLAQKILDAQ